MSIYNKIKDTTKRLTSSIKDRIEFSETREIELDTHEFSNVSIKSFNGTVELKIHDENWVRVESNVVALSSTLSESELQEAYRKKHLIRVTEHSVTVIANDDKNLVLNLIISLPLNTLKSLKFEGTNSKFYFNESGAFIDVHKIEATSLNGKVVIRQVNSDDVDINLKSGNIYFNGIAKNISVKTLNGDIYTNLLNSDDGVFKASTINGSISLGVTKEIGLKGKLNTNFGNLDITFEDCEVTDDTNQKLLKMKSVKRIADKKIIFLCETRKGNVSIEQVEGSEQ